MFSKVLQSDKQYNKNAMFIEEASITYKVVYRRVLTVKIYYIK